MVVKSKGIPPKCPKHSGLGIICPDGMVLGSSLIFPTKKNSFMTATFGGKVESKII